MKMNEKEFCALVETLEPLPPRKTLTDVRERAIEIYNEAFDTDYYGYGFPTLDDEGVAAVERYATIVIALAGDRLKPVDRLDSAILEQIELKGAGVFDMGTWHDSQAVDPKTGDSCGTSHCRSGWATTLAHRGKDLERVFDNEMAGAIVYKMSTGKVPNFYAETAKALRDIKASARRGN